MEEGGQVEVLFSPAFNLWGKMGHILSMSSISEDI